MKVDDEIPVRSSPECEIQELDGRAPFTLPLENIVIVDAILRERFFLYLRSN
ncbi:hypothetical protein BDN70DRAFT_883652 [Pholiota conissans]|uniref:Uncharacterized protein n=1 Tax=Pholiota conissans TaxID=109636 RepID=A0A9P5YTW6_9AGAR|nr:hypothetical protein BDN70DRAFT_883652 [Pholiota conissans]